MLNKNQSTPRLLKMKVISINIDEYKKDITKEEPVKSTPIILKDETPDELAKYSKDELIKIVNAYENKKLHIKGVNERQNPSKKRWADANKDYYKEYNKLYFQTHGQDKIHCEVCNADYSKYIFSRHKATKRHILNEGIF